MLHGFDDGEGLDERFTTAYRYIIRGGTSVSMEILVLGPVSRSPDKAFAVQVKQLVREVLEIVVFHVQSPGQSVAGLPRVGGARS